VFVDVDMSVDMHAHSALHHIVRIGADDAYEMCDYLLSSMHASANGRTDCATTPLLDVCRPQLTDRSLRLARLLIAHRCRLDDKNTGWLTARSRFHTRDRL
jgi:hypothetical protein